MTTDNQNEQPDGAQQADEPAPEQTAPGVTGEGGEQSIVPSVGQAASSGRPQRAPHLDASRRDVVTDTPSPERAMVTRAQRRRAKRREMTRRQLMNVSFWGTFGFGLTGALSAFLAFFWPRGVQGFGGKIAVSALLVPEEGDNPAPVVLGKFWLSHLAAGDGTFGGFGEEGPAGLVALWWKCPHLGCTVPYKPTFRFEGEQGWFRCPCHGSTYTRAGVRVFGPAPRPMDTMEVTVNDDGSLTVDSGKITKGGQDNPQRAVPYNV